MGRLLTRAKSRIISFRATEEEYEFLRNASISGGARSVSEFARSVACRENNDKETTEGVGKIDTLVDSLSNAANILDRNVQRLTEIVEDLNRQEKKTNEQK